MRRDDRLESNNQPPTSGPPIASVIQAYSRPTERLNIDVLVRDRVAPPRQELELLAAPLVERTVVPDALPEVLDGKSLEVCPDVAWVRVPAGTPREHAIPRARTPGQAARLGRDRRHRPRRDWERIKESVMYDVVLAKFEQHDAIRDILLATGDAEIVEHTANDDYWGDGGDGSGRNALGQILMRVRAELARRASS